MYINQKKTDYLTMKRECGRQCLILHILSFKPLSSPSLVKSPDYLSTFCLFNFFKKIIFYWSIIALQNFVSCQISTWISHSYTYIPPFWNSLPSPSPSHSSMLIQSPRLSFLSQFPLAIYFTYDNVSFHVTHLLK